MNTTIIKVGVAFTTGVVSGGAAVYFGLRKKFDEELCREVNEYRNVARKRVKEAQALVNSKMDAETAAAYNERVEADDTFTDYTQYYSGTDIKDSLNVLSREVNDVDFDRHMADREYPEDELEDALSSDAYSEVLNDTYIKAMEEAKANDIRPYVIDEECYQETCKWHDKIELVYYATDDKLADEQDDLISDDEAVNMLGANWARNLMEDGVEVVYIRNDQRGSDYIVCRVDEPYYKMPDQTAISSGDGPVIIS